MDWANVVSIAVAFLAAGAAYASQRSAAKASVMNTQTVTAVDREKEAYERARAFDTETIRRQDEELQELRDDNRKLHDRVSTAEAEAKEARAEAAEAKAEAAEAKRESQEVRAENMQLRGALAEFVARDNNPHS